MAKLRSMIRSEDNQSRQDSNAAAKEPVGNQDSRSPSVAKMVTNSTLSAVTLKNFTVTGDELDVLDLITEMKQAGNEAIAGNLSRTERMLANQLLTLDALFNHLAQRAGRQESVKGMEVMMRLALKAQSQARATAETLSVMKHPVPYIQQANISHGHQQVNNGQQISGARNFNSEQNKQLEDCHGQRMDLGAPAATGRTDQTLETVGAVHRPPVR